MSLFLRGVESLSFLQLFGDVFDFLVVTVVKKWPVLKDLDFLVRSVMKKSSILKDVDFLVTMTYLPCLKETYM